MSLFAGPTMLDHPEPGGDDRPLDVGEEFGDGRVIRQRPVEAQREGELSSKSRNRDNSAGVPASVNRRQPKP